MKRRMIDQKRETLFMKLAREKGYTDCREMVSHIHYQRDHLKEVSAEDLTWVDEVEPLEDLTDEAAVCAYLRVMKNPFLIRRDESVCRLDDCASQKLEAALGLFLLEAERTEREACSDGQ